MKSEFRLGVTQREVAFGQDCKAIIPADDVDSDLLFHAINARRVDILDMVDETSIGAGRLATELIENLSVRLPTEPNNRVAEEIRNLNSVAALKVLESETLSKLKDALLPKLMSGEIRVRDAEKIVEDVT
ncbi:hypothetical protein [Frankia sp. EI5c]|uniref:hypothetical protein n=1 Tax=Frankia sp. EI5c TaxID=683316 RepID=UPI0037BF7628